MPRIDRLKEELAVLREEYRNLFLYLLASLTGTVTSFYQVVTHRVEFFILIISAVGFMVSIFLIVLLKKIRIKMDKDLEEIGDLK